MLITMKDTRRGCNDGFNVQRFVAGETYATGKDIGDGLAREFVNLGYAEVFNPAGKE